jgi:hypothetical protein
MTSFRTCAGCASKEQDGGCDHLFILKSHISGLGVTLVKHRCAHRVDKFLPGDAVTVNTFPSCTPEDGEIPAKQDFPAIFISAHGLKAVCFIRPGTEGQYGDEFEPKGGNKGFVKVPLSRVLAREGVPRATLAACVRCGEVPSLIGCQMPGDETNYGGGQCLAKAMQNMEAA